MSGVPGGQLASTGGASHSREFLRVQTLRFRLGNRSLLQAGNGFVLREPKRLGYTLRFVIRVFAGWGGETLQWRSIPSKD